MKISKIILFLSVIVPLALFLFSCTNQNAGANSPRDIFGIYVGMKKEDAEKRLPEIANLVRRERMRQELWTLKNDPKFTRIAVGFDGSDHVRYVTAFTELTADGGNNAPLQKIRYDEFGSLAAAKKNPLTGNTEYVWEMPAANERDKFLVIVRGTDAVYANTLTLKRGDLTTAGKAEEE